MYLDGLYPNILVVPQKLYPISYFSKLDFISRIMHLICQEDVDVRLICIVHVNWIVKILYIAWFHCKPMNAIFHISCAYTIYMFINTLKPSQNGRRFADDTFKRIFFNENLRISIKISLKFVPNGPVNNIPALVQRQAII